MSKWLKSYRENHADFIQPASIEKLPLDPFEAFTLWFDEAVQSMELEANACVLSTYAPQSQQVSSRTLYLKEMLDQQFIFYTNYNSKKAKDLLAHPKASLLFFWPKLMRQIRIEGAVIRVSETISDAYFATRPRESQLGAWASQQSEKIQSRQKLLDQYKLLDARFPDVVPRPAHWGGFSMTANYIEFWQGQTSRLHERRAYYLEKNIWQSKLLQP